MAFLNVGGIEFPVFNKSMSRDTRRKGAAKRSFKGAHRDSGRNSRREFNYRVTPDSYASRRELIHIIEGNGQFIDCKYDLTSRGGLTPSHTRMLMVPTQFGSHGLGVGGVRSSLSDSTDPQGFLSYNAQLKGDWCVFWSEPNVAGSFVGHYAKRSDGVGYDDGTRNDNAGEIGSAISHTSIRETLGELFFTNDLSGDYNIDDIFIAPWLATESTMSTWTQNSPRHEKLPTHPEVICRGDFIQEDAMICLAGWSEAGERFFGPDSNGLEFVVHLTELDPLFRKKENTPYDTEIVLLGIEPIADVLEAAIGVPFSFIPSVFDLPGGTLVWSLESGTLPAWASLSSTTGEISGALPVATFDQNLRLQVTDGTSTALSNFFALAAV